MSGEGVCSEVKSSCASVSAYKSRPLLPIDMVTKSTRRRVDGGNGGKRGRLVRENQRILSYRLEGRRERGPP